MIASPSSGGRCLWSSPLRANPAHGANRSLHLEHHWGKAFNTLMSTLCSNETETGCCHFYPPPIPLNMLWVMYMTCHVLNHHQMPLYTQKHEPMIYTLSRCFCCQSLRVRQFFWHNLTFCLFPYKKLYAYLMSLYNIWKHIFYKLYICCVIPGSFSVWVTVSHWYTYQKVKGEISNAKWFSTFS